MLHAPRNRWSAAVAHLILSLLLVGLAWLAMLQAWFPDGLIEVAGMSRFILLLLGIDIVVGPVITLIIYKAGKRHLKLDLAIIALLQAAFFAYGLHALWQARPVYLVGVVDRLTLVFAHQVESEGERPDLPLGRPQLVGARQPTDRDLRRTIMYETLGGGADIDMRPRYYVPYAQVAPELRAHARPLASVPLSPRERARLVAAARRGGVPPERALLLPVMSSRQTGVAILSPDDLRPRRILGMDGYALLARPAKLTEIVNQ